MPKSYSLCQIYPSRCICISQIWLPTSNFALNSGRLEISVTFHLVITAYCSLSAKVIINPWMSITTLPFTSQRSTCQNNYFSSSCVVRGFFLYSSCTWLSVSYAKLLSHRQVTLLAQSLKWHILDVSDKTYCSLVLCQRVQISLASNSLIW